MEIRHNILEKSIGTLEEEIEAYQKIWNISIYFPIALIVGTFLQFFMYLCYNRWLHPFKVLVEEYKPDAKSELENLELQNLPKSANTDDNISDKDTKDPKEIRSLEDPSDIEVKENSEIGEIHDNPDNHILETSLFLDKQATIGNGENTDHL